MDADGATTPAAFLQLVRQMGNADCVVGSRWLADSVIASIPDRRPAVRQPGVSRHRAALFRLNIHDTQCGAKVIKREVVEKIHPYLHIADMAFDINLLVAIKQRRLSHQRSADRMDGQGRFQGHAVPLVADDVSFRGAGSG